MGTTLPSAHSIGRETSLACHLIGAGVTALGKANYADKFGEYYTAFFGLSVGIERLAKLILVAEYSIVHNGKMPEEKIIRGFGHKLLTLCDKVESISEEQDLTLQYERPKFPVCKKILDCLDAFADASKGRYANFGSLGEPNLNQDEPVAKWWSVVADVILNEHYYGKPVQHKVEKNADLIEQLLGAHSVVLHVDETGLEISNLKQASVRTGQVNVVQKYGRYYTLLVVRWLAEVFSKLATTAHHQHNVDEFFGVNEYMYTYLVSDGFLKTRKIWPLQ